jgi:hypothetical protein
MRIVAGLLVGLMLAGCAQQATPGESRQSANPDRYNRDRDVCRAQANADMKTRRTIDDSRREVFAGNYDRYGQGDLRRNMDNYGDNRSTDRLIADCMENRGYAQPQKAWWQKIGS